MADPAITQLTAELSNLAQSLRTLIGTTGRTAAAQEANIRRTQDLTDEQASFANDLIKGRKLNGEQRKLADDAIKLKRKELIAQENYTRRLREASDAIKKYGASSPEAVQKQKRADAALTTLTDRQNQTSEASSRVTSSFDGLVKGTKLAQAAMVWFGSTVSAQAKQLLAQQKANNGLIEGTGGLVQELFNQQQQALRMGLTGAELAKTVAANRQVVNALGGTEKAIDVLNPTIDRLRILTGSSAEALEIAAEAAKEFAQKGVRPSQAGMERFTNDLVQLGRQTGMNAKQAAEYYNEIANDIDSIDLLRSARGDEREAILANQRAMVQNSIAMGMTATQAKEAAKMLNKMVAAKPLDRLRQAARIRALGGAMGIQGSEEAAQAVIAGKRATPEQQKQLQQFNTNAANTMDQAAGQGLGAEIFASSLLDKLNLDEQFGKGSNFSTTLGDSLKPTEKALEQLVDSSKTTQGEIMGATIRAADQLGVIVSGNNVIGVALAGIAASVAMIVSMMAGGKALGMLDKFGKGGAKAVGGGVGGGLGRAAGVVGKLGAVGAVAGGLYEGYDEYQKTGKAGSAIGTGVGTAAGGAGGAWAGAASGAALGSLVGPIGTIIGAAIGGIAGGAGGSWLGGKAGKAVGSMADSDKSKAQEEVQNATKSTADGIDTQIKQMDTQNLTMQAMRDSLSKQVDLSEKLLIAMTQTDEEKQDRQKQSALRQDNKFATQYNYLT